MRYMILVKGNMNTEAGAKPSEEILSAMADYHEQLANAGVLLDANGLQPTSKGWRVLFSGDRRTVIDGPFTESKEVVAGYTIINVKSKEEAMQWVNRWPNPLKEHGEIEIRELFELEDFGESESIDRFRRMGVSTQR